MLNSKNGLAASDIIRSMMRLGFPREEIYDTLTGVGLPGEQIQLLIDRVNVEFEEAKLETRSSQISTEVGKLLEERMEELKTTLFPKLSFISQKLESKLRRLEARVIELQTMISRMNCPKLKTKHRRNPPGSTSSSI